MAKLLTNKYQLVSTRKKPNTIFKISLDCLWPELVQDGYCDDESNNYDCNFDGNDCCYHCVNKDHCRDCLCLIGTLAQDSPSSINPLIGDGYCQDGMNSAQCNFDGGDCCGSCVNTDYCTNCSCIGNILVDDSWDPVHCGGYHYASSCSECPQGNGASGCTV